MDPQVARSFEAVTVALRRLRPHLRVTGATIENGVRVVTLAPVPRWMLDDALDSLEHSDITRADAHLGEERAQPTTAKGWRRRNRRRRKMRAEKPIIRRETLD